MKYRLTPKTESEAATVREDWGSLTWLAREESGFPDITLGRVVIKPGKANPRHCHDNCEEILCLLRGRLRHTVGDETVEMAPGDTLIVPRGLMHNALNAGRADAEMIVAYNSGKRGFRGE